MEVRVIPSRFSYAIGCTISKSKPSNSKRPSDELATGHELIITILRKYGFMNARHVQRALNLKSHKSINAKKSLTRMVQQGFVDKYVITYPDDSPDNDVYILSSEARSNIKNFRSTFKYDMDDIPYILEHLSAVQWHLSVLEGEKATEKMFYKTVAYNKFIAQVTSLIKFKTSLRSGMMICAIPVPKGKHKSDIPSLIRPIISINGYLSSHEDRIGSYVFCLICESEAQIEDISMLLSTVSELSEIYTVYSLDCLTDDEELDPLSLIYDAARIEGSTTLSVIKLR